MTIKNKYHDEKVKYLLNKPQRQFNYIDDNVLINQLVAFLKGTGSPDGLIWLTFVEAEYILTTMNVKLLAASFLLVKSGALLALLNTVKAPNFDRVFHGKYFFTP